MTVDLYKITSGLANVSSTLWNSSQSLIIANIIINALNDIKQGGTKFTPKNLLYDVMAAAGSATGYNMKFNSDGWETIDLSNANLVYVDIYATSVNTTTLSDSGNSVLCVPIASGIWRIYSWGTASNTQNEKRIFSMLFDNLAHGATDPTGVTGYTSMRCSETTYRDKKIYSLTYSSSLQTASVEKFTNFDANTSGNYTLLCDYMSAQEGSASGACTAKLYAPSATLLHTLEGTTGGVSNDERYDATVHNFTGTKVQCSTTANNLDGKNINIRGLFIVGSGNTVTNTLNEHGSYTLSTGFTTHASAPDASYPITASTLVSAVGTVEATNDTGVLWDFPAIDATSTLARSVSFDNGVNYLTVSLATLFKTVNTGTQAYVKWTITRTDNSKVDRIKGFGLLFG